MSLEVRVTVELGDTDGLTAVRVSATESVLKPLVSTATSDMAALGRATLGRVGSEVLAKALTQAEQFVFAMKAGELSRITATNGEFVRSDGAPMTPEQSAFLGDFPAEILAAEAFVHAFNWAASQGEDISPNTRELIMRVVEEADPDA